MKFSVGPLDTVHHQRTYFTPVAPIIDPDAYPRARMCAVWQELPRVHFALPGCGAIGNIGRNIYHGPSGFYSDLSVSQSFRHHRALPGKVRH